MVNYRPPLFSDSDLLPFRRTPASEYRIPYTFVESLNEGTLFDRSARIFEEAARTQRLYDAVVGEDQRIIGAGMLQDTLKEADGHRREEELGALMVHPAARGIGIVGLMIKLMLVHRYAVLHTSDTGEDYVAHVVDGNHGPIHALLAAGFEDLGPMKLHPGEFDGHIEHMMAPGRLRAHACLPLQSRCHRQPYPRPLDLLARGAGTPPYGPEFAGEGGLFRYGRSGLLGRRGRTHRTPSEFELVFPGQTRRREGSAARGLHPARKKLKGQAIRHIP